MWTKKQHLEPDMEQLSDSELGRELQKRCVLSPCLFNCYAEYIIGNTRLDNSQAGIKIARYADDTTVMAESKEELKSLLMKMKEKNEKVGFKLTNQKTKIMASSPIIS